MHALSILSSIMRLSHACSACHKRLNPPFISLQWIKILLFNTCPCHWFACHSNFASQCQYRLHFTSCRMIKYSARPILSMLIRMKALRHGAMCLHRQIALPQLSRVSPGVIASGYSSSTWQHSADPRSKHFWTEKDMPDQVFPFVDVHVCHWKLSNNICSRKY